MTVSIFGVPEIVGYRSLCYRFSLRPSVQRTSRFFPREPSSLGPC